MGAFCERLGRQGVVLLVEGQLGRGEVGLDEVGLLLHGDVVELVEHLAGIGPAEQEEPPEREAVFGPAEALGGRQHHLFDRLELIFRSPILAS